MRTIEGLVNFDRSNEVMNFVKDGQNLVKEQFGKKLREEKIFYKEELRSVCINPLVLEDNVLENLNSISKNFSSLMDDFTLLLKKNRKLSELVLSGNPIYSLFEKHLNSVNVDDIYYRLDGIVDDGKIKIIEANMDSPGGIFSLEKIHEIGLSNYTDFDFKFLKGSEKVLNHFISNYQSRFSNGELFAVVGDKNDEGRSEHRAISKKLRESGIPSRTLDYRDNKIKLRNSQLYYGDQKIGVFYRRVFPLDFNPDFFDSEETVFLNSPGSYVLANKALFSIFHELKDSDLSSHKRFIEDNISYTSFISNANKEELVFNKDSYVIKELSLNCGKGVYVGKEESLDGWRKIVFDPKSDKIVQEYHEPPMMNFIDNKFEGAHSRKFDFNLYCIGSEAIMPYVRVNAKGSYKSNFYCGSSAGLCFLGGKK